MAEQVDLAMLFGAEPPRHAWDAMFSQSMQWMI